MLEHICGVHPVSFKFTEDEMELWQSLFDEDETERYIIISVLKQSKEEFEQDEKFRKALQEAFNQSSLDEIQLLEDQRNKEIQLLDNAISGTAKLSITDSNEPGTSNATSPPPVSPLQPEAAKPTPTEKRPKTPKEKADPALAKRRASAKPEHLSSGSKKPPMAAVKPPFKSQKSTPITDEASANQNSAFDFRNLLEKRTDMPEELLKQRAEYLRQQRDKLVEAKHRQREKQLIEAAQKNATERPRTSQAARGALRGDLKTNSQQSTSDMLEARRAIANRIREQVMGAGERSETKP